MILVSGATGFIGRRLVPHLMAKFPREKILCLVKVQATDPERQVAKTYQKMGLPVTEVDLVTGTGLPALPASPRLVFHLAANTDTADPDHRCNDIGTKNLVAWLRPNKKTHLIYTGTTAIMAGRKDCRRPFTQADSPSPTNEYGRSKLRAEQELEAACHRLGFALSIVRLTTVYGSQSRPKSMFDILKKQVLAHSLLTRLNWPGRTGLIHVDDVAQALVRVALDRLRPGQPRLMILSAEALTMAQISQLAHRQLGVPYHPVRLPDWLWQTLAWLRRYIYWGERLMPQPAYNLIWRAGLLVDHVIDCDTSDTARVLKNGRVKLLSQTLASVLA